MKLIDGADGEIIQGGLAVKNSHMYYIGMREDANRPQLYRTHLNTQSTEIYYKGMDNERVRSFLMSPDGQYIALYIDLNGSEKDCLHIMNVNTGEIVFQSSNHVYFDFSGIWVGHNYYFSRIDDQEGKYEWVVFSCETFSLTCLAKLDEQVISYVASDGLLHVGLKKSLLDVEYAIYDLKSNQFVYFSEKIERMQQMFFWQDELYAVTDRGGEYIGLFRVIEQQFVQIDMPVNGHITRVIPYKDSLVIQVNEQAAHSLYIWNDHELKQLSIPVGVIHHAQSLDERLIFILDEPTHWGRVMSYHLSQCKLEPLLQFSMSQPALFPTDNTYNSFDDTVIHYMHYEADSDQAIIYIHGGPEFQAMKQYYPLLQRLRNEGYNIFVPNIRGSDGYGRSFVEMDDGMNRLEAQRDIIALIAVLIERHGIDARHISIIGESYGGYTTLSMITRYPAFFNCAVAVAGMSNLNIFFNNTASWRIPLREKEYGDVHMMKDFFEQIAPLTHAKSRTAPLLIAHGMRDIRVSVDESLAFFHESDKEKPIRLQLYDDEGHEFCKRQNIEHFYTQVVQFFREND